MGSRVQEDDTLGLRIQEAGTVEGNSTEGFGIKKTDTESRRPTERALEAARVGRRVQETDGLLPRVQGRSREVDLRGKCGPKEQP